MTLIAATLGSRAAKGGAALAKPFDGRNLDLLCGPSPQVTVQDWGQTTTAASFNLGSSESGSSSYQGTAITAKKIRYAETNPSGTTGQAYRLLVAPNGASLRNVDSDIPIQSYNNTAPTSIVRSRFCTDINAQRSENQAGGSGAVNSGGSMVHVDCSSTSVDAFWPGYSVTGTAPTEWTTVDRCRAVGAYFNYYGGHLFGGTLPYNPTVNPTDAPGGSTSLSANYATAAQIIAAKPWAASMAISPLTGTGAVPLQLITVPGGPLGSCLYQVIGYCDAVNFPPASGYTVGPPYTLGSETATGSWPGSSGTSASAQAAKWDAQTSGETGEPFVSGNVLIATTGGAFHSDASQFTTNQRVLFTHGFFADFANSCSLCQNASGNNNALPVMNIVYEDLILRGGGTYDIYIQTQTGDHASTLISGFTPSASKQGPYTRNADGTWSWATNVQDSRPWLVVVRRNTHLTAISPLSPRPANKVPTFNYAFSTDGVIFVSTKQKLTALLAAEFPGVTAAGIEEMQAGTYDWTVLPTPDSAVLEARYQALASNSTLQANGEIAVHPGNMSALTMVLLEMNCVGTSTINTPGSLILPHSTNNSTSVPASQVDGGGNPLTDAYGFYAGT